LWTTRPANKIVAIMKLIRLVGGVLMVGVFVLTFYFMFTYTGPFQWLAETQLRWWGSYEEKLTFLFTFILLGLPAGAAVLVLKKLSGDKGHAAIEGFKGSVVGDVLARLPFLVWRGVGFLGLGGFMWWESTKVGTLAQVSSTQLETGFRPPNRLIEVEGVAIWEAAMQTGGSSGERAYVPVVSRSWDPRNGVSLYLEMSKKEFDEEKQGKASRGTYWGTINLGSLPGLVRVAYERSDLAPAKKHVVINFHADGRHLASGKWLALGGGIAAIVGLVWMLIRARSV
jgi:hypothetical protein